jgi:ferredoxin-NADP reductase
MPSTSRHQLGLIGLAGIIAMASKYLLAYRRKLIFNPAAFAAIVLGLTKLLPAVWWIGSPVMMPLTLIFGFLILRKIRRFQLFLSFLLASLVVAFNVGAMHSQTTGYILSTIFKSSPLIFLGTIMLTEPETSPPTIWTQRIYGLIVGAIFSSQLRVGIVSATPEMALIVGNIFSFAVSPRYKLLLHLKSKKRLAPNIYDFTFVSSKKVKFNAGQYMEWTLPNIKFDSRGNRRSFSIASAPGSNELHVAIKAFDKGSNYKQALISLNEGDSIIAGHLGGDFTLPKDKKQKLAFIAGGIGITPFVSMVEQIVKLQQKCDIVLFYIVSDASELCYKQLWQDAAQFGVVVIPLLGSTNPDPSWQGLIGRIDKDVLKDNAKDYEDRLYYLSGPIGLVENYRQLLLSLGIKRQLIKADHFSGY